jgi:hypothetical protein
VGGPVGPQDIVSSKKFYTTYSVLHFCNLHIVALHGVGGPVGPQDIVSRKKNKKVKSYPQKNIFFFLPLWDNNIICVYNRKEK